MAGPVADPLTYACPQCSAPAGEKCRNYLNRRCAPHRLRVEAAAAAPAAGCRYAVRKRRKGLAEVLGEGGPGPDLWEVIDTRAGDAVCHCGDGWEDRALADALARELEAADGTTAKPKQRPTENDFDESTPPPRVRPKGDPVPRWVELPPGEPVALLFERWDREGRVPAGSVLCRFVGTSLGMTGDAGLEVLAGTGLGVEGFRPTAEQARGYRVAVTVREKGRPSRDCVVLAPAAGGTT